MKYSRARSRTFGCTKLQDEEKKSLEYLQPDLAVKKSNVDKLYDIYSIRCICREGNKTLGQFDINLPMIIITEPNT